MNWTMRILGLERVHILRGIALVFFALAFCPQPLSAQTICGEQHAADPARGRWQLLKAVGDGSDVLRYESPAVSCTVPLRGQAVSPPQKFPGSENEIVATRDGRVMSLPRHGALFPLPMVKLDGRITAMAVSAAGAVEVVAVATQTPENLLMLDGALQLLQRLPLRDRTGKLTSPVCNLLVSPQRQSFVAVFSDMPEMWELSYNPLAPEIGLGMVHDFQYREGHFVPGFLNPMRTALPWNSHAAGLDEGGHMVLLQGPPMSGPGTPLVIHLDVRKPVREDVRPEIKLHHCELALSATK